MLDTLTRLSQRTYRALLIAYPGPFRCEYSDEMVQVFADQCRDALHRRKLPGLLLLWLRTLLDLCFTAWEERKRTMLNTAEHRFTALVIALLIVPLLFVTANVTKYELGFDSLYVALSSLTAALHLDSSPFLRDLLVIGGALLAAGLLALRTTRMHLGVDGDALTGTLTFRAGWSTVAILGITGLLLGTMLLYAFAENVGPL
jgi:hypothetical protein